MANTPHTRDVSQPLAIPAGLSLASASAPILEPHTPFDTGTSLLKDTSALAKDISEALENVPYVKAVAGIIVKICEIYEQLRANKDRCREIIEVVCRRFHKLLQSMNDVKVSSSAVKLESLKDDIEEYERQLGAIYTALLPFTHDDFASKTRRLFKRSQITSDLAKLERLLEQLNGEFNTRRLVAIEVRIVELATQWNGTRQNEGLIPQALPPSPIRLVGHQEDVDRIVAYLLNSNGHLPRVSILGPGGVGKTTVACAALNQPVIRQRHQNQFFVPCDSLPTIRLLLYSLADLLGLAESQRTVNLESLVVHLLFSLPGNTIMVLDNLETLWDDPEQRPLVDGFLALLSGIGSGFTLIITMRGIQNPSPSSISWMKVSLQGVDLAQSVRIYKSITSTAPDDAAEAVLKELDGIPLAISLFARLVTEGDSPDFLLDCWKSKGTRILEDGGSGRLSKMGHSIDLSIHSPWMNDSARRVLGLLACLPSGLTDTRDMAQQFQSCLPDAVLLDDALLTLRRVGLVHRQKGLGEQRWSLQMLSPIRDHCTRFLSPCRDEQSALITQWCHFLEAHDMYSGSSTRISIATELSNIRALLMQACETTSLGNDVLQGIERYCDWAQLSGMYDVEPALKAVQILAADDMKSTARLYQSIGRVAYMFDDLDNAEYYLLQALHKTANGGEPTVQANTHKSLGDLLMRQGELEQARESYRKALDLFLQIHSRLGQANTQLSLGDLHMQQGELEQARESYRKALDLFVQIDDQLGQANTHKSLGDFLKRQDELEQAGESYRKALNLFIHIDGRLGQADTHLSLGDLLKRQDELEKAKHSYSKALDLFVQIGDRLGQANTHRSLGDLLKRQDELEQAKASYHQALSLFVQIGDRLGQANTHKFLGDLLMRQDELEQAGESYHRALDLFVQIDGRLGQANTHLSLGDLLMRQDELEQAGEFYHKALGLFYQIDERLGQADTYLSLGDLLKRQDELKQAGVLSGSS